MDSVKCLDLYVCGKASVQEETKEHSVGVCSSVICVKPDETSRSVTVGVCMAVICIWQNIQITTIWRLTGMMHHQLPEGTLKSAMDIGNKYLTVEGKIL